MKEILVDGSINKEYERLNIVPNLIVKDSKDMYKVHTLSEKDYTKLVDASDSISPEDEDKYYPSGGWRRSEGIGIYGDEYKIKIKNKPIKVLYELDYIIESIQNMDEVVNEEELEKGILPDYITDHSSLYEYMCEAYGISTHGNVAGFLYILAKINNIGISELVKNYC